MDELQKLDKGDELNEIIVTHQAYGEDVGYIHGWELEDMEGKTYRITPNEREGIMNSLNNPNIKVIDLGKVVLATHQIKKIRRYRTDFGPRAGEA
jgi:hypothetical protein